MSRDYTAQPTERTVMRAIETHLRHCSKCARGANCAAFERLADIEFGPDDADASKSWGDPRPPADRY